MTVPAHPKIYHFTHVDNLTTMLEVGSILSDSRRIAQGVCNQNVANTDIKSYRLTKPVPCHAGTKVGDYTPFYFCPRSIMLSRIWYNNDPEQEYKGGQTPIIHFESDVRSVIDWADSQSRHWAFTNGNARSAVTEFYSDVTQLDKIDWSAVMATDFRPSLIKERKQAEFLLHQSCPIDLINKIGVINEETRQKVLQILAKSGYVLEVAVMRSWYFP